MNKVQVNMMTKLLGRDMIERKLEEMGEQSLTDFFFKKTVLWKYQKHYKKGQIKQ